MNQQHLDWIHEEYTMWDLFFRKAGATNRWGEERDKVLKNNAGKILKYAKNGFAK